MSWPYSVFKVSVVICSVGWDMKKGTIVALCALREDWDVRVLN